MGLTWNSWYNPLDNIANIIGGDGGGGAAQQPAGVPYTGTTYYDADSNTAQTWNGTAYVPIGWVPNSPGGGGLDGQIQGSPSVLGSETDTPSTPVKTAEQIAKENADAATRNTFNTGLKTTLSSAEEAARQSGVGYNQSIQDWLLSLSEGQNALNQRGTNAEMNKQAGQKGILDMVGRGIRSGGVMLANKNAGDSSASEAMAKLYGNLGERQMQSDVMNPYALEMNQINLDQGAFNTRKEHEKGKFGTDKVSIANSIVSDATQKLNNLNAMMEGASLPERIAIQQEQDKIRNGALAELSKYDAEVSKADAVGAQSDDARRQGAADLRNAGKVDPGMFNFTTDVPNQFQNTGPFASELPIFTYNRNKRQ